MIDPQDIDSDHFCLYCITSSQKVARSSTVYQETWYSALLPHYDLDFGVYMGLNGEDCLSLAQTFCDTCELWLYMIGSTT